MSKQTNTIEATTGKAIANPKVTDFAVQFEGDKWNLLQVASECESIDQRKAKLEGDLQHFGKIVCLIAAKAGSVEVFRSLCNIVEEQKHWGRPHKDMPESVKKLYHGAPDTYKVYKSYILTAMEAGLMPGQEYTLVTGKGDKETVKLDTPQLLTKAKLQETKGTPSKGSPATAGIHIDSKGEAHEVRPRVNVGKGTAPEVAQELSAIADLFMQMPDQTTKAKHLRALQALRKRMEGDLPEHKEAAKEAINS